MNDLIDRAEAQTELQLVARRYTVAHEAHGEGKVVWSDNLISVTDVMNALREIPPAQPERAIPSVLNNQVNLCDSCRYVFPECPGEDSGVLYGNGTGNDNICACNKYQPSVQPVATDATSDTISRQAAIDALDCINGVEDVLRSLPTVQPEPKEGHWIQYDKRFPWRHHYKCSECGNYLDFSGVNAGRGEANYCPNCGADMRETKVKCGDEDTLQGGLMSAT